MKTDEALGWAGTFFIIAATLVRAADYSHFLDLTFSGVGSILWLTSAIISYNRPLLAVNVVAISIITWGLLLYWI